MIVLFSISGLNSSALHTLQSLTQAAVAVCSCIQPVINGRKEILAFVKSHVNGPSICRANCMHCPEPWFCFFFLILNFFCFPDILFVQKWM